MTQVCLWKGIGAGFSPDPVLIDDLIGKRLRKGGHKGTRTRGKCTFASTSKNQAEDYADGPDTLMKVIPQSGAIVSWVKGEADLIMAFEDFLRQERWGDADWATPRGRDIIFDVMGCIATFERYVRIIPRSRVLPAIVDEFVSRLCVREIAYQCSDQISAALNEHNGEVWITGPCQLVPAPQSGASLSLSVAA